jgi:hypothetical protein
MKTIKVDLKLVDWLVMPSLKRRIEDGATVNHHILKRFKRRFAPTAPRGRKGRHAPLAHQRHTEKVELSMAWTVQNSNWN